MELYAKGQLSFLILTCMRDRDFYGLDIISEILERSNGRINLKKPSVYSNLSRMEKQGYISSYLRSSDFGPNRKYYSLTEQGRAFYEELKAYFDRNNIDVFKDFNDGETDIKIIDEPSFLSEQTAPILPLAEEKTDDLAENHEEITDEDGFFDFSFAFDENDDEPARNEENQEELSAIDESPFLDKDDETKEKDDETTQDSPMIMEEKLEEIQESSTTLVAEEQSIPAPPQDSASNTNTYSIKQALLHREEKPANEPSTDGGVFLSQESADAYNKRLYDISRDINKYRKKRSFAEDQISMATADALVASNEKKQTNLEDFKNALLQNKTKYQDQRLNKEDFDRQMNYRFERTSMFESPKEVKEEIKNDAVYITNRLNADDVEKPRKIEPPQLKIISENTKENKLPAPKRDIAVDPSHKEILTNLYSRTKDSASYEERADAIYDYNDLKDYYNNQEITFNVYQKPTNKIKHNTNKLYMIVSVLTFIFASLCSAGTYIALLQFDQLNPSTNFLYILLPALLILDVIIKVCNFKRSSGWMPNKIMPQWAMWLIYVVVSGVIIGLNFAFSLSAESFGLFANTLILPLVLTFVAIPFNYYAKRVAIVKYWK